MKKLLEKWGWIDLSKPAFLIFMAILVIIVIVGGGYLSSLP